MDPITVEAFVSETEVGDLAPGQTAIARLVDGTEAKGEITFISRSGDEETRTFAVEVTIPNPQRSIRAGMTAEVSVALPPRKAHRLPQNALTLDDEGRLGVRVAEEGVARFYPITILREEPDGVWIAGLPAKAEVIVIGQDFVRDGGRVAAVPAAEIPR
jgi:multidrug efflux system membrane fusion protein